MNDVAPLGSSVEQVELPDSWICATLADICGEVHKVEPESHYKRDFIYVDIGSIDNDAKIIASPKRVLISEAPSRARQLIQGGDVLFSTVRTYLKNIAPVSEQLDGQIASTGFCVLRGCQGIVGRYLYWYCLADAFVNRLAPLQRGTSYPAVRMRI